MTKQTKCTVAEAEALKDEIIFEARGIMFRRGMTNTLSALVLALGGANMLNEPLEISPGTFSATVALLFLGIYYTLKLTLFQLTQDHQRILVMADKFISERQARRRHCRKILEAPYR